jgi:hypothetical protein
MANKNQTKQAANGSLFALTMRMLLAMALCIGSMTGLSNGDEEYVNAIKQVKLHEVPAISNDSIIYKMDIDFKDPPLHFWSYSDSIHHAHIIEIYGVALESPRIRLPDNSPFQSIRIKNHKTKMSISGLMSAIFISVDPEYSCHTDLTADTVITVTLWKKMNALKGKKSKTNQKPKSKK